MTMSNQPTKSILLTGASGYLGQHVLYSFFSDEDSSSTRLQLENTKIHIYALHGGSSNEFEQAVMERCITKATNITVSVHVVDLTDSVAIQTWFDEIKDKDLPMPDICIHMAAMSSPRICQEHVEKAQAINVPTNFFQALANHNICIIALSTDQVYEGKVEETLYKEESNTKPVNVYGKSKYQMEQKILELCSNVVILRSSIILGPPAPLTSTAHTTFLQFCASRSKIMTSFYVDECRSVISVKDVVTILHWFLLQNKNIGAAEIYNMGGPQRISRVDMAQAVFRRLGYDEDYIQSVEKASLPPSTVPSPLDITMDSSKLTNLTQHSFQDLKEIVQAVFPL